jgi:hypothetical protein
MEPVGNLLGDEGSVATGSVVDGLFNSDLVLYGII